MKILYDYQIFSIEKYGGISRYFCELMKSINNILPIVISNNYYLGKTNLSYLKFGTNNLFFKKYLSFFNKLYTLNQIRNLKFDIYHPTYYNSYLFKKIKKPIVVTIHDMIHENFSDLVDSNDPTIKRKALMAKRATRIIAVSENTKKDIIQTYGISPKKIDVVYHGDSFSDINLDICVNYDIPERYILYTGKRRGYKNFDNFILAVKKFVLNDSELFVVCAGGGSFNKYELELFKKLGLLDRIVHKECSDQLLKILYSKSLFFIYPSMYEGFGIPLLEAMSSDTAILCSNTSCFPEVAGDCAIYFDPYSISDIQKKINYALNNKLTKYKELGKHRLLFFTWEKTIENTQNTYKKALEDFEIYL